MYLANRRISVDGKVSEIDEEVIFPDEDRAKAALKRGAIRKKVQNKKEFKTPKETKELKGTIKTK